MMGSQANGRGGSGGRRTNIQWFDVGTPGGGRRPRDLMASAAFGDLHANPAFGLRLDCSSARFWNVEDQEKVT